MVPLSREARQHAFEIVDEAWQVAEKMEFGFHATGIQGEIEVVVCRHNLDQEPNDSMRSVPQHDDDLDVIQ